MRDSKTDILKTVKSEINKESIQYDLSGRVQFVFTASSFAVNGDPCIVKEYVYYFGTNVVKGRKEGYGVWSDSFVGVLDSLVDELDNFLINEFGFILGAEPVDPDRALFVDEAFNQLVDENNFALEGV